MGKTLYATLSANVEANTLLIPGFSCWAWNGVMHHRGYGVLTHRKKWMLAHRAAYAVYNGPIPSGRLVCHSCDNPWCVRPDHLFVGTPNDNMQDKVTKGRQSRGDTHGRAIKQKRKSWPSGLAHHNTKLDQVLHAQIAARRGLEPQSKTAKEFGVSQTRVSQIQKASHVDES